MLPRPGRNLARLVPAVRRAVEERKLRRDRRVLFDALKENEERYRSLVENIPLGMFRSSLADNGRILQANRALADLYGCDTVEELYGIKVQDLYYDPREREGILMEFAEKGRLEKRELRLRRKDGAVRWVRITAVAHRNSSGAIDWIDGMMEDFTEVRKAEEELKKSEEMFRGLFECNRDAIMITEPPAWAFTSGNPAALEMFGAKDLAEFIAHAPWQLSPERQSDGRDSREKAGEMIETALREGSHFFEWTHRRIGGGDFPATVLLTRMEIGGKRILQATVRDVTEQELAETMIRRKSEELDLLLKSIGSVIIGVSVKDRITHWNAFAESTFGIGAAHALGRGFMECGIPWDWRRVYESIGTCLAQSVTVRLEDLKYERPGGKEGILGITIHPLVREGEIIEGFMIMGRDLTERRMLESQLLQARKLEAIGQLAAGVAHEINTPLQFVGDNLKFIMKSVERIIAVQKSLGGEMESAPPGTDVAVLRSLFRRKMEELEFDYLAGELPKAAEQSLDGVSRMSRIVQSMKAFAHPGTGSKSPADINISIENTVTVSRNEWKYDCEMELDLDRSLPQVPCFEAELNQVVLNLIVNAVDAVKDAIAAGTIGRGLISIRTKRDGDEAVISVSDNGPGVPAKIRDRIFDPFFTTKEVGKGTGQGLAIAHSIIAEKHGGSIYCEDGTEGGAAFVIRLPLE